MFPISRDPPEGGTTPRRNPGCVGGGFPISRDPPEGGTWVNYGEFSAQKFMKFPISRDPPEGGTLRLNVDQSV